MPTPKKIWRVRVKLAVESWVEITADTPAEAEMEAVRLPNVIQVFGRSAIRGEIEASPQQAFAIQEELFSDRN